MPFVLPAEHGEVNLGSQLWFIEDEAGKLSLDEVIAADRDGMFQHNKEPVFKRGITGKKYWFKVTLSLPANLQDGETWLLEVDHPWLAELTYYYPNALGAYDSISTGYTKPFASREIRSRGFVFPLPTLSENPVTVYFSAIANGQTIFPLSAFKGSHYIKKKIVYSMGMAVYYGILIAMLVYNVFVFLALRSPSYFLYVTFIFALSSMSFVVDGYAYMFFWPDAPQLNIYVSYWLPIVVALLMLMVTQDFLEISSPLIKQIYRISYAILLTTAMAIYILPLLWSAALTALITASVLLLIVGSSTVRVVDGYLPAKYFLIAWLCLLTGGFIKIASILGLAPYNFFTQHAVHIGATLQVLLLAFALANRINILQDERSRLKTRVINETNRNSRLKNDFLALISHELRTPMNGVEGTLELMKMKVVDEEMRNYIETAANSAADMMSLVDSILSFSEAQSGSLALREIPFSLKNFLKPIKRRYTRRCSQKGLLFNCLVGQNVPNYLIGDAKKISEVIDKLIDNAVKFTDKGSVSLSVWQQELAEENGYAELVFKISDTGRGVKEKQDSDIFDSFSQQEEPLRRQYGGLGIGLAMCKQLVRLMDGDLSYTSRSGKGCQFQLSINLKIADAAQIRKIKFDEAKQQLEEKKEKLPRNRPTRVLVVEDNNVNQKVLTGILKTLGCEVLTANNGVEALLVLEEKLVDLVLMDCQMPVMDGFEATRLIRKTNTPNKEVPIIAVTANALTEDEKSCRQAGMNDFMKKPVKKAIIEEKLNYWLDTDTVVEG